MALATGNHTPATVTGHWQDGTTTGNTPVTVKHLGDKVVMEFADGRVIAHNLAATVFSSRMANVPLRLEFSDGSLLTVPDGELAIALALARGKSAWISMLETHLIRFGVPLLAGAGLVIWVFVTFALPAIASAIAARMPVSLINGIGDEYFASIRHKFDLIDDASDPERLRVARLGAAALAAADPGEFNYRFLLASGKQIGVNAFALPNGHITMSKKLSDKLDNDGVFAVLAHEIGHVELRASMQQAVRLGAWSFITTFLFNDYSFLVASVVLAELSYSRQQEIEADCFGIKLLKATGRPTSVMLTVLDVLHEANEEEAPEDETAGQEPAPAPKAADKADTPAETTLGKILGLLSTHPDYQARKEHFSECASWEA